MTDLVLGLLAIVVGLIFCFAGSPLMRFVITLWGALVGFGLGAGLVAHSTGDHLLATALSWTVGLILALVFAVLAYLYYAVAVVLAMGGVGFALAGSLLAAIGVTWNWVIILVGVAVGIVFAVIAIMGDLPLVLLQVLSAIAGAAVAVSGLMLLVGAVDSDTFTDGGFLAMVREDWWWWLVYAALAIVGLVAQSRAASAHRDSMRRQWEQTAA